MKKTVLNILRIAFKCVLACALFVCVWVKLTPLFRTERNPEGDFFRNLPEQTLDVVALGSSHMQYAFSPAFFYTRTGLYSYVLGSPCQPLSMTYSLLRECLKRQSPSVAIIDVFTLLPQSEVCYADGMFYRAIDEMSGTTRAEAADLVPDESVRLQYKYDLLMNHDNWKTIDLNALDEHMETVKPSDGFNYDLGYVPALPEDPEYYPLVTYEVKEKKELLASEKEDLDRIMDLCRENDIRLIFVKTPYVIDQDSTDKLAAVWAYLDEKGAEYIDYVEKADELDWFVGMDGDSWHNNSWGAKIVTDDLAARISGKDLKQPHREDPVWEELLKGMVRNAAYLLMNVRNVNVYHLLEDAAEYPSILLCRYKAGKWTTLGDTENEYLQRAGLNHDFVKDFDKSYYAVVLNGVLLKESSSPFSFTLHGHKIVLGEDEITIDGASVGKAGEMDLVFASDSFDWVNPIPVDYQSRWFWKNGCEGFRCTASE